ncbi:MAG TPA: biopolymer transporter ExbD [Gammaproteobacteria bacterium]|nr:biopolymer transporter ExbD [Gammaproteobacteria bacterium]
MRMRRRRSESSEISSHGIDLAPMLDFCINLLIFFIVTAVFIKQYGVVVNRPAAVQQQQKQEKNKIIQIQILDSGKISMDQREVDVHAVRADIERTLAVNPKATVLIIAQEGAPTGVLVQVVDQAHLAGVYNVTFATQH